MKKSRSKAKKRTHKKKPGFHPTGMKSKGSVAPPIGEGIEDSFEESGDNIDVIVAPAFEDSLASKGENLSLYFENIPDEGPTVEMSSAEVQTVEEMVPKSELMALKSTSCVDSSTNTDELETDEIDNANKSETKSRLVDCSTNTEIKSEDVHTELVECSTTTDDFDELQSKPSVNLTETATITEPEFLDPIKDASENRPIRIEIATNTDGDMLEPDSDSTSNILDEKIDQEMEETNDPMLKSKSILDSNEISKSRRDLKLQRNERVKDENDDNFIEMKPKKTVSTNVLYFKSFEDNLSQDSEPITNSGKYRINIPEDQEVIQGTRGQPVGADGETDQKGPEATVGMRQRIFKVVFVGDSGVGKSSFIHRFCNDNFNPSFSATIGVDFQVKSLILGGQHIVLQLWDTAGQERFRSITKQYFRKADGVVIMYDVNCESTFTNVRNWMESVQEGVEEGTIILLIGNKTDMAESESDRAVKTKDGNKLSVEYDGIFFETSAKGGINVKESMEALANILKEKEDKDIESALNLDEKAVKKKFCCG